MKTETLDKLYLEWSQYTNAMTAKEIRLQAKYNELIMAVANKFPGETRHETALRYIQQAEQQSDNQSQQQDIRNANEASD